MPGAGQTFVHRIDANDDIVAVDHAWRQFAAENGAPELGERAVGVSLWRFVLGEEVRQLYEHLLDAVRERAVRASVPYRCDSPSVRRFMRLDVLPLTGGQVEFRSSLLHEERRDPVDLLGSVPRGRPGRSSRAAGAGASGRPAGWRSRRRSPSSGSSTP